MEKENPFTLTFGKKPELIINREEDFNNVINMYSRDHSIAQTYMIEGIRGSGKTVLMTTIAKELEARKEWIVVNLDASENLIDEFARALENKVRKMPSIIDKGLSVSVAGFGIGVGSNEDRRDSIARIEDILEQLKKKKKRVLITIDEVVPDENMRHFASRFQIFLRDDYPLYLVMTGMHENVYSIQNDPQLTFLLRSPKLKMGALSIVAIIRKYENIFNISENEARELAGITKGYAFAFQALGMLYWDYRRKMSLDKIVNELDILLDEYVYKKIWSDLTAQEKKLVLAIEDDTSSGIKELVEKSGINSNSISKYRERLIDKGVLVSPEYGYLEQALPRFNHIARLYNH